jgi:hypothetical protein
MMIINHEGMRMGHPMMMVWMKIAVPALHHHDAHADGTVRAYADVRDQYRHGYAPVHLRRLWARTRSLQTLPDERDADELLLPAETG